MKLSKSHTISEYNNYCKSFSFKPLSNSTWWQILKALTPGAQQAVVGLDNVTVNGLQGFKTIENIVVNILDDLKKINDLKNGKRYLKWSFQLHMIVLLTPTVSLMLCTTAVSFTSGLFVYFTYCIKILC